MWVKWEGHRARARASMRALHISTYVVVVVTVVVVVGDVVVVGVVGVVGEVLVVGLEGKECISNICTWLVTRKR